MCYTRKDHGLDEEARRLRLEKDRRRKVASEAGSADREHDTQHDRSLTEKAKEMVGAR